MSCNFTNWRKVDWKRFSLGWDSNPCLPDTHWALLLTELESHTLGVRKICKDYFFVEETYLCSEITQIEPWQTQVSWNFSNYRIGRKNIGKKTSLFGLAQNVGGVEKSGNKFVCFFFLCRKMFYRHFECTKNCLRSLIC